MLAARGACLHPMAVLRAYSWPFLFSFIPCLASRPSSASLPAELVFVSFFFRTSRHCLVLRVVLCSIVLTESIIGELPTKPRRVWDGSLPFASAWRDGSRPSPKQVGHVGAGWPWGPHDKAFFFCKASVELQRALLPKS